MVHSSTHIHDMVYCAVFAILIAVCSWISIPTTIPFTLQTLGVVLACNVLGGKRGTCAVLIYILLGAIGAPVFSGFTGGIGIILGSTGGYIVGFLVTALTMWAAERLLGRSLPVSISSMLLGITLCYLFGSLWFQAVYTQQTGSIGFLSVLSICVFPFIIPDVIKIAVAVLLSRRLRKWIR